MKTLTRKITAILSGFLKNQRQRLVRRALESEIAQTFRRLESRRVLSVTAVFGGGVLDITIANDGLGTDAALLTTGANFFVDADGSNTHVTEARISLRLAGHADGLPAIRDKSNVDIGVSGPGLKHLGDSSIECCGAAEIRKRVVERTTLSDDIRTIGHDT